MEYLSSQAVPDNCNSIVVIKFDVTRGGGDRFYLGWQE